MTIAERYVEFGEREAGRNSPIYRRLSAAVAADERLLDLLATLPPAKQQPNLLFGVVRLLGGPLTWPALRDFVVDRWDAVAPEVRRRVTQTNEVGRCAALMPVLASLTKPPDETPDETPDKTPDKTPANATANTSAKEPARTPAHTPAKPPAHTPAKPLALIDVGASAGLTLFPDKYAYRYGTTTLGSSTVTLDCDVVGLTLPTALPAIASRTGVDLNPLDVTDPDDVAWLEALIWPEQQHRRDRLRAAIDLARADPPNLVRGGLEAVPDLVARAEEGTTPVVYHTSVLYQVTPAERDAFVETVRALPGHWISIEAPQVLDFGDLPAPPDDSALNVLALDGRPLAWVRGHGQAIYGFE